MRLVGNTNISTSGGNVTITGGTEGIYSESGSSHNLSINAGAGDVVVGNQTGFGNGTTESLIGKVTLDSTSSITLGDGDQEMHSLDVFNSPLEQGAVSVPASSLAAVYSVEQICGLVSSEITVPSQLFSGRILLTL